MSSEGTLRRFLVGFLNPTLYGAYVFIFILSGIVFGTAFQGYGSWLRVGALLFCILIPATFGSLLIILLVGQLQILIWSRLQETSRAILNAAPLSEALLRSCLVALVALYFSGLVGGQICKWRAKNVCQACDALIASFEHDLRAHGTYATNAAAYVRSNDVLRRKFLFYFGRSGTNGVHWEADRIAKADVSLFVTTNRFQCIVPIERLSPVSFSSFYVFSYTSERPKWNKVLLHWSMLGSYIDDPQ